MDNVQVGKKTDLLVSYKIYCVELHILINRFNWGSKFHSIF